MGGSQSHRILSKDRQPELFKQPRFVQPLLKEWAAVSKRDRLNFASFKAYFLPYAPDGLASTLFAVYAKHHQTKQWSFEDFQEFTYFVDTRDARLAVVLFEMFVPVEVNGIRVIKSLEVRRCALVWFEEQMPESVFGMEGKEIDVKQFEIVLNSSAKQYKTFSWIFEINSPYKNVPPIVLTNELNLNV
jgi:hypothetical protein